MITEMQEFVSEQTQALAEQARKFREDPVASARAAAETSADAIKSLKSPIHAFARSGVKLTTVSENAVVNLIELQSQVITSAMTDAARRLERAARAENIMDLVRDQAEMLVATRDRVVDETKRAVEIFTTAGSEVRDVGTHLFGQVFEPAGKEQPKARAKTTRARKTKRAARKAA
jgi:phasin family protein